MIDAWDGFKVHCCKEEPPAIDSRLASMYRWSVLEPMPAPVFDGRQERFVLRGNQNEALHKMYANGWM